MKAISIEDLIRCAVRELALRKRVYAKKVLEGRMSPQVHDHEIACMEAIVAILKEKAQPGLPLGIPESGS